MTRASNDLSAKASVAGHKKGGTLSRPAFETNYGGTLLSDGGEEGRQHQGVQGEPRKARG